METSTNPSLRDEAEEQGDGPVEARRWLESHEEAPLQLAEAVRFFDSCDPVAKEEVRGQWHGSSLQTGHPFDGLLEALGWYGKAFLSDENVHPLLFRGGADGLYSLNANLIPRRALALAPLFGGAEWVKSLFRSAGMLLRTMQPSARLRRVEHRGVTTATMVYDTLPIQDAYRRVDASTLLGWMEMRGMARPYLFVLRRDRSPGILFEKLAGHASDARFQAGSGLHSRDVSLRAKD